MASSESVMISTTLNSTERVPCLATKMPPLCSGRYLPSKYGMMNFSFRSEEGGGGKIEGWANDGGAVGLVHLVERVTKGGG